VQAVLAADNSVTQAEELTIRVDTIPPVISVSNPADNDSYLNLSGMEIVGAVSDENLAEYSLKVTGPGVLLQKNGIQNRAGYTFGTLSDLPEDAYTLVTEAKDVAENQNALVRIFTIDRTAPRLLSMLPSAADISARASHQSASPEL